MAEFHPHPETLIDYAAGTASGPVEMLVAAHMVLCPDCRQAVEQLERLGGILLDGIERQPVAALPPTPAMAVLPAAKATAGGRAMLPGVLRDRLGGDIEKVRWRGLFPGVRHADLPGFASGAASLMKIAAGRRMPRHTHRGTEMTLVLAGGFSDASGHYGRGDLQIADPAIDHQPVADRGGDCVCLVVVDGPLRFTGRFGRLLNLFGGAR